MESCHTTAAQHLVGTLATRLSACLYRCETGKLQPPVNQFSLILSLSLSLHSHILVVLTFLSLTTTLIVPAASGLPDTTLGSFAISPGSTSAYAFRAS